jgi:hypothetical protein
MLNGLMRGFLALLTGFGLIACTSAYRLESGRYQITLESVAGITEVVRVVDVQAAEQMVTVQNPGHALVLKGPLNGNRLVFSGEEAGAQFEFSGQLTADNLVEGEVLEKTGGETERKTRFRMVPLR